MSEIIQDYRDVIDEIMDNFDFHKVERVMTALGWTWSRRGDLTDMYQPDVSELRTRARQLMRQCVEGMLTGNHQEFTNETGGFLVRAWHGDNGKIYIRLDFTVENWDNFD